MLLPHYALFCFYRRLCLWITKASGYTDALTLFSDKDNTHSLCGAFSARLNNYRSFRQILHTGY